MRNDMTMPDSDERQVATTLSGIRTDHTARYEWAARKIKGLYATPEKVVTVADYGCGVGYGSSMMREVAQSVLGFDRDETTLCFARDNWRTDGVGFVKHDLETGAPLVMSDVATAFEIVEHLADPKPFLSSVNATKLFVSVPNELVFPWSPEIKHHHRHYTMRQFMDLLEECGWAPTLFGFQYNDDPEVKEAMEGDDFTPYLTRARTLCIMAIRAKEPVRAAARPAWEHPTQKVPESVMLLGLGPSKYEWTEYMLSHDFKSPVTETWTVNKGVTIFPKADVAFVMDDIADYATKHPNYGTELSEFAGVLIGQSAFREEAASKHLIDYHDYPLEQVLYAWGASAHNWLHTISIGYVLAYAGLVGVKRLMLAGIDCSWPNNPHLSEAGNAVVCYWIGRLEQLGCEVIINSGSTLNSTNRQRDYDWRKFYGYLRQPNLR